MNELERKVGERCLEAISRDFDEKDIKNIGNGIRAARNFEDRIVEAENRMQTKNQERTELNDLNSEALVKGILKDMGEERE